MDTDRIQCPNCGTEIEVGEVLASQISEDIEARIQREAEQRLRNAVEAATTKERQKVALQIQDMTQELEEKTRAIKTAEAREVELRSRQRQLETRERELEAVVEQRVAEKQEVLAVRLRQEANAEVEKRIESLEGILRAREAAMAEARERELQLIKDKRELEDARKDMELRYQRRLDDEKREIEKKIGERYALEADLKLKERDKQIAGLRDALADAKRKSDQGSMETQGEALELDLEANLLQAFPGDDISPVPKGIRGADVVQNVRSHGSVECGRIVWEAKNTKAWNNAWLDKLKDDQRAVGANLSVIVSTVLPEQIKDFGLLDGVWVASISTYLPLAAALRQQLTQVAFARAASEGQSEKMEMVYRYLSGDEFRQKVEAIVDTFVGMQEQLAKERRAYERLWKEREKQIQRIVENTAGMYGDIRGLIGASVQEIKALSLDDDHLLPGSGSDL
jgi:hypothetical protein